MVFIFFHFTFVFTQSYPRIITSTVAEVTIKGTIDNKYPITIHLEYAQPAECFFGVYTLKGWYFYDKFKTKIPLSGLYYGDLVLYNFPSAKMDSQLVYYNLVEGIWPDTILNLQGYTEKFYFKSGGYQGIWKNNGKKLPVKLKIDDLNILEDQTYLLFNNGRYINLTDFFWQFTHYRILGVNHDNSHIIIEFSQPSRGYACGQCGAAIEEGIYDLFFNDQGQLLKYNEYLLQSCWDNLSYKIDKSSTASKYVYYVENSSEAKRWSVVVDLINHSIEVDSTNNW